MTINCQTCKCELEIDDEEYSNTWKIFKNMGKIAYFFCSNCVDNARKKNPELAFKLDNPNSQN